MDYRLHQVTGKQLIVHMCMLHLFSDYSNQECSTFDLTVKATRYLNNKATIKLGRLLLIKVKSY
jgi:hypothetical protein